MATKQAATKTKRYATASNAPKALSVSEVPAAKIYSAKQRKVAADQPRFFTKLTHLPSGQMMTADAISLRLRAGLAWSVTRELKSALDVPNKTFAQLLGVSNATISRRRPSDRLGLAEGDRAVRFARLLFLASKVMGSEEHGRIWLKTPQVGLGGVVPLDHAITELGAREVEDLLGRIEYGVYT